MPQFGNIRILTWSFTLFYFFKMVTLFKNCITKFESVNVYRQVTHDRQQCHPPLLIISWHWLFKIYFIYFRTSITIPCTRSSPLPSILWTIRHPTLGNYSYKLLLIFVTKTVFYMWYMFSFFYPLVLQPKEIILTRKTTIGTYVKLLIFVANVFFYVIHIQLFHSLVWNLEIILIRRTQIGTNVKLLILWIIFFICDSCSVFYSQVLKT